MCEEEKILSNLQQELKRGTLVLSVLLNSTEPCYGYSLVKNLNEAGVDIEQNTLYPLLRRLEKQKLLESLWNTTESRPRKYYQISEFGKIIRDQLYSEWVKTNSVIEKMVLREK